MQTHTAWQRRKNQSEREKLTELIAFRSFSISNSLKRAASSMLIFNDQNGEQNAFSPAMKQKVRKSRELTADRFFVFVS